MWVFIWAAYTYISTLFIWQDNCWQLWRCQQPTSVAATTITINSLHLLSTKHPFVVQTATPATVACIFENLNTALVSKYVFICTLVCLCMFVCEIIERTLPDRKCIFISTKKLTAFSTSVILFGCMAMYTIGIHTYTSIPLLFFSNIRV